MKRALLLLLLSACGGTTVGQTCTADSNCAKGQFCLAAVPGGYCTEACATEGDTRGCPGGSVCAQQAGGLYCSAVCGTNGDCRTNYNCEGVSSSTLKACRTALP